MPTQKQEKKKAMPQPSNPNDATINGTDGGYLTPKKQKIDQLDKAFARGSQRSEKKRIIYG